MKNRWYLATILMIAGFIGILFLSSMIGNRAVTTLSEVCPALAEAENLEGTLFPAGEKPGIPLLLTDEQYMSSLLGAEIREEEQEVLLPAMKVTFRSENGEFLLTLGKDGQVLLEEPSGTRRVFKDPLRSMFSSLYEEHLLSGGGELPAD